MIFDQVQSIEYALVEQKVLEGLKSGNEVLKQLNNEMRLEDVEKLMDDTADAIAYQKVPTRISMISDVL